MVSDSPNFEHDDDANTFDVSAAEAIISMAKRVPITQSVLAQAGKACVRALQNDDGELVTPVEWKAIECLIKLEQLNIGWANVALKAMAMAQANKGGVMPSRVEVSYTQRPIPVGRLR